MCFYYRDSSHTYQQHNARCPDGEEDEKEYQGLIIREREGRESNRTNGLISYQPSRY
jgi:hypothetical protein